MRLVLVDTSSWIHMLRAAGDKQVRRRVEYWLESGAACWCPPVRLELWNGAGQQDRKMLVDFEKTLTELPITEEVWDLACDLAQKARAAGLTVPASDILIAACARYHDAELEHSDSDFDLLPN